MNSLGKDFVSFDNKIELDKLTVFKLSHGHHFSCCDWGLSYKGITYPFWTLIFLNFSIQLSGPCKFPSSISCLSPFLFSMPGLRDPTTITHTYHQTRLVTPPHFFYYFSHFNVTLFLSAVVTESVCFPFCPQHLSQSRTYWLFGE